MLLPLRELLACQALPVAEMDMDSLACQKPIRPNQRHCSQHRRNQWDLMRPNNKALTRTRKPRQAPIPCLIALAFLLCSLALDRSKVCPWTSPPQKGRVPNPKIVWTRMKPGALPLDLADRNWERSPLIRLAWLDRKENLDASPLIWNRVLCTQERMHPILALHRSHLSKGLQAVLGAGKAPRALVREAGG